MSTIETTAKIEPMEASVYHAMKPHVSQSMLKEFGNRRRLYEGYYVTRRISRPEPTAAMEIGTACHAACLEPDRKVCVEIPEDLLAKNGATSTTKAKEFIAEQRALGLIPLKAADLNIIDRVRDSFMNAAKCLLELRNSKVYVEHSMTWTDESTGMLCKARPDWLIETKKAVYVLDIKTCQNASPEAFARAMGNMDYGIQRAHYLAGARSVFGKPAEFYFVASEVVEPFASAVYHAAGNRFDSAELRREKLMQDLAECHLRNDFKEPWEGLVNQLDLPYWAEKDVL